MATQTLTVSADGAVTSGWRAEGGDYTRLQSDDGDTSRLYTPTNTDIATFAITDTSGLSGATINSVTVYAKFRSLDPVSNLFKIGVRHSSTNYWSADKDTVTSTAYILFSETWSTNPGTSSAWTVSDLDALEIGLQKTNGVGGAATYMYAVVDYTTVTNVTVTPDPIALALTTYAPTARLNIIPVPGVKALTLTTFAPTVVVVINTTVTPGTLALTTTAFAPTVTVSNNIVATPGVKALSLTTFAPTIQLPQTVTPGVKSLVLSTFAPTIVVSNPILVTPSTASLVLMTYAPTALITLTPAVYTPIRGTLLSGSKSSILASTSTSTEVASSGTLEEITAGSADSEVTSTGRNVTVHSTGTGINI